ncbi:MAG TPA: hypothetical protein VGD95_06050 [Micavibrio sp.]
MDKNEQEEIALSRWSAQQMLQRLTPAFNLIALFVAAPEGIIAKADQERRLLKQKKLPTESGFIERYRARISLKLHVETCAAVMRDFCTARVLAMDFQAANVIEDKIFLERMLEIGRATESCAAYLSNCLNVMKGSEKRLKNPDGPVMAKIDL